MPTPLENYVKECGGKLNPAMTSYVANLQLVSDVAPEIAEDIVKELATQRRHLKLVASENYCSLNVHRPRFFKIPHTQGISVCIR